MNALLRITILSAAIVLLISAPGCQNAPTAESIEHSENDVETLREQIGKMDWD